MGGSAFFSLLPYYHYIFLINVLFCLAPFIPSCLLSAKEVSANQSYLRWLPNSFIIILLLTDTSFDQLGASMGYVRPYDVNTLCLRANRSSYWSSAGFFFVCLFFQRI